MGKRLILLLRRLCYKDAYRLYTDYLIRNYNFKYIQKPEELKYYSDKKDIEFVLIPYGFDSIENLKIKIKFIKKIKKNNPNIKFFRFYNEYNLSVNGDIWDTVGDYYFLTNFEKINKSFFKYGNIIKTITFNMNCLSYLNYNKINKKYNNLIYWGTFRENRLDYFKKYLNFSDIIISTGKKSYLRFKNNNINNPRFIKPIKIRDELNNLLFFKYSIYIEDKKTHDNYNYPANRFYEAIAMDILLFFDINTRNTWNRYGLKIPKELYVNNYNDIKERIRSNYYRNIKEFYRNFYKKINEDFKNLKEINDKIFITKELL